MAEILLEINSMYHYTYWLDDQDGKSYIGMRSCKCAINEDTYMGSSKSVKDAINNGKSFTKKILAVWPTRHDALLHEILLHEIFDVDSNPNFYNKAKQTSTKFSCSTTGMKHTEETKELIRKMKLGENNHNYGKRGLGTSAYGHRHTDKQKETMKNFGARNGMFEKKHTPEAIQLMIDNRSSIVGEKNPFFGKKHKEESKCYGEKNHMFGKTRAKHHNAKKVNTPFGIFDCVLDAAESLAVNPETIRSRVKSNSKQFKEYFYLGKINDKTV